MKSFLFQRYASVRCNSLMIVSSLTIHDNPGTYKFWAVTPLDVIWGHPKSPNRLLITFDWEEIQTWELGSCVCHTKAHRMMCNMTCLGQLGSWRDLDLRSNFEVDLAYTYVILYIFRRALTRETRWYKINFLPLPYQKLFSKSHFEKYHHFDIDYLWSLTQWPHLKSVDKTLPGFFQGYLMIFADLFYHGFDMLTIACRNTLNWGKCDVWWHLVTSILAWEKYYPNCFQRTLYELSNIFFVFRYNVWSPRSRTIPSLLEPARNRIKTLGDT